MSREDVIRSIVDRETRELALSETDVRHDAPDLYRNACKHFGTWDTALRYAGVSNSRKDHKYSANGVKRKIKYMWHATYNLVAEHVKKRDRRLYRAAVENFGSWDEALRACGINPDKIQSLERSERPTRQQMIDALVTRSEAGLSVRRMDVLRDDFAFAKCVKWEFGCWRKALVAAGLAEKSRF